MYENVYKIVSSIPRGKVSTYGRIAKLASIKSPRLIGRILHNNPNPKIIPCHRVVFANGNLASEFAFGGNQEQKRRLEAEGVEFIKDKVNLKKFLLKI